MAVLPAAPGSKLVLATAGGSPGWLLGPLRFAGAPGASGTLAGPLFYAALWVALGLYVAVLATARALPVRVTLGAVAVLHVLFFLAPPLLSQDVFSYIAYARLGVEHHLNPYVFFPFEIAGDPIYGFAGSKAAVSAYGPAWSGWYGAPPACSTAIRTCRRSRWDCIRWCCATWSPARTTRRWWCW
jgi:hypothetical protein